MFWLTGADSQGKGYATEAARALIRWLFAELRLRRVVATTERDHRASIAVMRRLGMTVEANAFPQPAWFQVMGWLDNE